MSSESSTRSISSPVGKIAENPPSNSKTSYGNIFLATLAAQFFGVSIGMVGAYSSPACADMKKPGSHLDGITDDEISWIASLPFLSGMFGNALSGYVSHRFGRKATLMFLSVPFTLGWLIIAYAPNVPLIYVGRLVSGTCTGMCMVAIQTYVVEISTVEIRGLLASTFPGAVVFGVFIMTGFGIFLRWTWLAIAAAIIVVLGAALLCFMPESPAWLMQNNRRVEATKGLQFLRGREQDVMKELNKIVQDFKDEPKVTLNWTELLNPSLYKPLIISLVLTFCLIFSGFPAIITYSVKMLDSAGISINPNIGATIVVMVQVLATIVGSLLIDKAGRKILFIATSCVITISLTIFGIYSYYSIKYTRTELVHWTWVPIFCLVVYLTSYSIGFGSIPYVVVPELVPTSSRSFVVAASSVNNSLFGFITIKTFDIMQNSIGLHGTYWTYALISLCGTVFYWFIVPETKGRTIQDINKSFS